MLFVLPLTRKVTYMYTFATHTFAAFMFGGGGPWLSAQALDHYSVAALLSPEPEPTLREAADVLHPDHAPPPGKTDTHFTVRRQYVEACSCCGGGCRWGMVVEPSQKKWHSISPIELRAQTYIMPYIMRPDPAVESNRFGNQIPNMSDRYKWVRLFRPDLGEALAWVSTFEHSRQVLCSPVHGVQPPVRSAAHAHARNRSRPWSLWVRRSCSSRELR